MKKSKWIWLSETAEKNQYAEFLSSFIYKNGICKIKISVDTEYALFVNGAYVTSGQYADFPWYKVYDEIDITDRLTEGENKILILAWYMGDPNYCHYVNRAGVRFELTVGGECVAYSSEKTLCRPCPYLLSGEGVKKFNNQLGYSFVWQQGFSEEYKNASCVSGMPETLIKRPIKNLELLPFAEAKEVGKIYDLGAETVGYPYLEITADAGERVTVSFGEWLDSEGRVPRKMLGGRYDYSFEIVGTGYTQRVFNPLRKIGCRYFEPSGNCTLSKIGLFPVRYPFLRRSYKIDGERRQKIYDTSVKTLELCALEHYIDCPLREQAFWTFDSRFQMRYGYIAFAGSEYQRAALELLSQDRRDDSLITMVVPAVTKNTIPSFTLSYIMAMAEYIEATGNGSLAEKYFEKIKSVMAAYLDRICDGLIPNFDGLWNFYEWKAGYSRVECRYDSILNLMAAYTLDKLIYICNFLGDAEGADAYLKIKKDLIATVRARFFNKDTGLFVSFEGRDDYSELANSLAVLSGATDGEEASRICEIITKKSVKMTETTLSMTAFKYDALILCDRKKYSDFIISDIDKNFGMMLDAGATSFWETLLGKDDFDGSGSLCHGWSALAVYYYGALGLLIEKTPGEENENN